MCGSTFLVLFMGNFFTTLGVVYNKYMDQDKTKALWTWHNSTKLFMKAIYVLYERLFYLSEGWNDCVVYVKCMSNSLIEF